MDDHVPKPIQRDIKGWEVQTENKIIRTECSSLKASQDSCVGVWQLKKPHY